MSESNTPAAPEGDDFADLKRQANMIDGAASPGSAPGEQAEDPTTREARELHGALTLARMMVAPMFGWWPEFGTVWSDATLQGISNNGAAVLVRNGWSAGELFEKWGPYIGLAVATAPPCIATYQAIEQHKAMAERARKASLAKPASMHPPATNNANPQ